jgi:hypothetical protein
MHKMPDGTMMKDSEHKMAMGGMAMGAGKGYKAKWHGRQGQIDGWQARVALTGKMVEKDGEKVPFQKCQLRC